MIEFVSQQIILSGFGGRKALNSIGKTSTAEVLRLRATSSVSGDKSVRRSAQDDDSVGEPEQKQQVPFDFAQGRLSTALRSGRDDKFV
jgi:hypothetical protein